MGVLSVVHALIERQLANDDAALTVNPYRRGCDLVAKSVLDDMHVAFIYDRRSQSSLSRDLSRNQSCFSPIGGLACLNPTIT